MASVTYERVISKHEFDNHCILLQDKQGKDFRQFIAGNKVLVTSGDKTYYGDVSEYYLNGKFVGGIHFDPKREDSDNFYYEQSINQGHHAKVTIEEDAALQGGKYPVSIEMKLVTR